MKASIEQIESVLREKKIDPKMITQIVTDLEASIKEEKEDREPKARSKNQYVFIASDKEGILKGRELVGWAVQIENEAAPQVALDRVKAAGLAYNKSRKGSKKPVKTIGEVFDIVPRRFWQDDVVTKKTLPKTKLPVLIQSSDNIL